MTSPVPELCPVPILSRGVEPSVFNGTKGVLVLKKARSQKSWFGLKLSQSKKGLFGLVRKESRGLPLVDTARARALKGVAQKRGPFNHRRPEGLTRRAFYTKVCGHYEKMGSPSRINVLCRHGVWLKARALTECVADFREGGPTRCWERMLTTRRCSNIDRPPQCSMCREEQLPVSPNSGDL